VTLTIERRNAEFVDRYRQGETLEAIAKDHGVTRERVRQIIKNVGGPAAIEARVERARQKAEKVNQFDDEILNEVTHIAVALASRGSTRSRVVKRLALFYPQWSISNLEHALAASSILFRKADVDDFFSNDCLYAGVMCVLAGHLSLEPDLEWAAVELSDGLLEDLTTELAKATLTSEHRLTVIGLVAAADRFVKSNPETTITGKQYEALREDLVAAQGLESMHGKAPWPPTRQTLAARYNGWNEALIAFGMGTAGKGRPKGLIKYTDDDYTAAVVDFVVWCELEGAGKSFARFDQWVQAERHLGRARPVGASVRNYFGSWHGARVAAEAALATRP
jgi:hypothetical protein